MPHFFINSKDINENIVAVSDKETINHVVNALRTKLGEDILFIDENQIQYECKTTVVNKKELKAEILKKYPSKRFLDFELSLAQSPLNSSSQTLIIEKATELGVNNLYPIFTDNCSVKKTIINLKTEKWQKIMFEASKQCERAFVPTCHKLTDIQTLCNKDFDRIIAFTERLSKENLKTYLAKKPINTGEKILIIIGPEGGFSKSEFDYFESNSKIEMLSLGNLILKADTAVITAIGNIVL